jgi:hypothetical protein
MRDRRGVRLLGRPRYRWGIIVKWGLNTEDGDIEWIDLAFDKDR